MTTRQIGMGLLLALALVGCGSSSGDSADRDDRLSRDTNPDRGETSTTSTTAAPSTTSTLPPAADGTDLQACSDGECEVVVSPSTQLPFDPRLGIASASIEAVGPDGVDITFIGTSGFVANFLDQQPNQGGASTYEGPGGPLSIQVVAIVGDSAVVRFFPG